MKRPVICLLLLVLVNLLTVSSAVYGDGRGVVIEGNPIGTDNIGSLNPLVCTNVFCRRITDFLFPMLYAVDPVTGLPTAAAPENYGLAAEVAAPTSSPSQIRLRDDLLWSDGTPVTAYDVFYSYAAAASGYIESAFRSIGNFITAARVIDEHTIEFAYSRTDCSIPARTNLPIVPAHVFDPDFQKTVDDFGNEGDLITWYKAWQDVYPGFRFRAISPSSFNSAPTVTAGMLHFAEVIPNEEIRLATDDGEIAFVYRDLAPGMDETQFFLTGNSNILINPPYENRDDLLVNPDFQIAELPGSTLDYIAFNMANPGLPRGAFNGDDLALEQGQHPIFGDVRVRQAIQMAINVDALIDTTLLGYGTPLASGRVPGTWGANESLKPSSYDPYAAERLLDEAGWRSRGSGDVRRCVSCLYTSVGSSLYFDLMVASNGRREVAANMIAEQLFEVGIGVNVLVMDTDSVVNEARYQQFDAYMAGQTQRYPTELDQSAVFTRANDVLYTGGNTTSYFNPQVDELMTQAFNVPECDTEARTDIYHDVQSVLQEDLPYIWLYASQDMVVSRGIAGVAPYVNQPFWNIRDWIVVP